MDSGRPYSELVGVIRSAIVNLDRSDGPDLSDWQLDIFLTCYLGTVAQTVRGLAQQLAVPTTLLNRALDEMSSSILLRRMVDPYDHKNVLVVRTATGMALLRELNTILRDAGSNVQIVAAPVQGRRPGQQAQARTLH